MSGALNESMLLVEIKATGEEICVRRMGFPARWLAARPTGVLMTISGLLRLVVKARIRDILSVFVLVDRVGIEE